MMGDFNAQVENNNKDIEHIMGRHGIPCENENENGQLLIEFCGKHGLLIGGTVFLHKDCHKIIWISPDKGKQVESQIDHIYRVSQEEWTKLRESVPYVKLYRYNPKHLYPKLNGYGDNGQRKVWTSCISA